MGIRTGNPEWKDYPDTSTRVYAQHLNAIEDALDDSAPALGPDDNYVTDAEKAALHTHPAVIAQGATAADARTAIGAAAASDLAGVARVYIDPPSLTGIPDGALVAYTTI